MRVGGWVRTLEKRALYVVNDYIYRKKHGELKCIYCLVHICRQTFPVNKIVIKTKVLTLYYIFQFIIGSGVIRNAYFSMISLLQGKKCVLEKYYAGIFSDNR